MSLKTIRIPAIQCDACPAMIEHGDCNDDELETHALGQGWRHDGGGMGDWLCPRCVLNPLELGVKDKGKVKP